MERSRALQRPDQGPWTLRGQGLGLWPKVVDGPGFEDEENIEVVPAEQLRGAVGALRAQAAEMRGRVEPASWKTYEAVEVADMLDSFADRFGGR